MKKVKYKISEETKNYFCSVLLLEDMVNFDKKFNVLLEGDDNILESIFGYMLFNKWVDIVNVNYVVTDKGRDIVSNYLEKLYEFRSFFKVFCSIDLQTDEIGFRKFFDFDTDEQFYAYLQEDRFEDLRVAVCEYKGIDPLVLIFFEFLDSGSFDFDDNDTWQFDLVSGLIWDNLLEVANTNLHISDLDILSEDETGEEYISRIISDGSKLMLSLIKKQSLIDSGGDEIDLSKYKDPSYISPCWQRKSK